MARENSFPGSTSGLQLEQMTSVKGQPLTRKRGQRVAGILTAPDYPDLGS